MVAKVSVASPSRPYLGLRLDLHPEAITALISDENLPPAPPSDTSRALSVNPLDDTLLDALLRLLRLLDTPRDIPFLAPMIKRELLYRLMMDGQGAALRQTVLQDSQLNRVAKAIRILRDNYAQPLRVEDIARDVHMSVSSLHHHFKQATAMSPLQYQKHLRLQEARRIMLADDAGVALAAHAVGYESSSQFSREYSRLFARAAARQAALAGRGDAGAGLSDRLARPRRHHGASDPDLGIAPILDLTTLPLDCRPSDDNVTKSEFPSGNPPFGGRMNPFLESLLDTPGRQLPRRAARRSPVALRDVASRGWRPRDGDMALPVLTLDEAAFAHNTDKIFRYVHGHGAALARMPRRPCRRRSCNACSTPAPGARRSPTCSRPPCCCAPACAG